MGTLVEENKSMIIFKLGQFEKEVVEELGSSHIKIEKKLKPYDDSIAKIETDMLKLMTNLGTF